MSTMRAFFLLLVCAGCANSKTFDDEDSGMPLPDSAPMPDSGKMEAAMEASTPACMNMVKDNGETDVDCGGGACNPCADDKACVKASDCANGSCFAGHCGPRVWFAESNGSDVAIPGNQMWIAAPGASLTANLYAASLVYLRWSGTARYVGGGNGICHLGQRFVIDGMPTGDPTWGNAIMVQRGSTRWHEPFNVELAVPLAAGMHTISTEMTNAQGGYATCNLDGDSGAAYDRNRLVAVALDTSASWYAESTGTTGVLGAGSGWTDVPGAALTIPLASASHVQLSLQGSENVGSPYGHCAYRLVVDNAPLGDPNHGQAISVGDGPGGWWAPVGIKYGQDFAAGSHSVKAQMRNSGGAGQCEAGNSNLPYSRFRLLATASAQGGNTQSFESTGGSQVVAANSMWTPVTGLSASFNLGGATTYMMVDVDGTERAVNGSGHCAYRLVIDGTPMGDMTHGMAISVGDGANAWWSSVGLAYATKLGTGLHSINVELRNSSSGSDCGVNGDGLGYGRMRMLLRSF